MGVGMVKSEFRNATAEEYALWAIGDYESRDETRISTAIRRLAEAVLILNERMEKLENNSKIQGGLGALK